MNQMEKLPECVYRGLRAWIDVDYVRNVRKKSRDIIAVEKVQRQAARFIKMIINQDLKDASRQC